MNSAFKFLINFNNRIIDIIDENKLSDEDIDIALKKGYQYISGKSPIFLIKYEKILNNAKDNKQITEQEIKYLLNNDYFKSIDELYYFYFGDGFSDEAQIPIEEEKFKDITIDFIKRHLKDKNQVTYIYYFINREELIYDYLDLYPLKINTIFYAVQDYRKLFQIIKKHHIKYDNINCKYINKQELLLEWIKDDPRVLLNKTIKSSDISEYLINYTNECIKNSLFSLEEVLTSPIGYQTSIVLKVLEEDFSKIDLLTPNVNYREEIINIFIDKLPNSIEYLNKISKLFPTASTNKIKKIKEKILSLDLTIGPCQWKEIYEDKEIMLKSFKKDPLLLIKSPNTAFFINRLTPEEEDKIISIIRENNVVFNGITLLMMSYPKIKEEALRMNPYILDKPINNMLTPKNLDDILIEQGYQTSIISTYHVFQNNKYLLNQLKDDISIVNNPYFDLCDSYNSEKDVIDVYNLINTSSIELTSDLVVKLCNPLIYIDALKKNIISLNTIYKNFITINYPNSLIIYIQNNYSKEAIENAYLSVDLNNAYFKENKNDDEILFRLEKDFSYCKKIHNVTLTDKTLKKIADIYLSNREDNYIYFDSCDFIKNNPYIVLYENMYYETSIKNIETITKYKNNTNTYQLFINELKNGKVKSLNANNSVLLFNYTHIEDIKEILEQNPQALDYYKGNNDKLNNIVRDMFREGKYIPRRNASYEVCGILLNDLIDNPGSIEDEQELIESGFANNYNKNSDIARDLLLKALITGKYKLDHYISSIIMKSVNKLTKEQIKKIILSYPENIIGVYYGLEKENKEVLEDPEIKAIFEKYDQINQEIKEKNHTKVLTKIKENPKDTIFSKNNSQYIGALNKESFFFYHNQLVEQVKKKEIDVNNVSLDVLLYESYQEKLDILLIDYLANNEPTILRNIPYYFFTNGNNNSLLINYKDKISHNTIIDILESIKKISVSDIKNFISDITDEEAYKILISNKDLTKDVVNYLFDNKSIDMKKLSKGSVIPPIVVIKVLEKDIHNYQYIPLHNYAIEESIIYQLFKNGGLKNPYLHPLFMENSMIQKEFSNVRTPITECLLSEYSYKYISEEKLLELTNLDSISTVIINSYMINPEYLKYFLLDDINQEKVMNFLLNQDLKYNKELAVLTPNNKQILNKLLENDFQNTIDGLGNLIYFNKGFFLFNVLDNDKIVELCLKNKYILTEKSNEKLKCNKDIIMNSIVLDYNSIKYCDRYTKFSEEEKKTIKKIFMDNNIHYYDTIFPFLLNDKDYLVREIDNNPYIINDIPSSYFGLSTAATLYKRIKEKVKNKEYHFSVDTSKWILEDRELLLLAFQECPELIEKYDDLKLTFKDIESLNEKEINVKDNPIEYINDIINNYQRVDDYELDIDKVYPQELLDKLIDILINNNYKVTTKTSPVLMKKNMVYYALKNEYDIDSSFIKKFINFENLYITKDKELFKKYINMGYGTCFKPYIDIWGLDKSIDLISLFGCYISKADILTEPNQKAITKNILDNSIKDNNAIDIFIRGKYEFTDEEIINGIIIDNNTFKISDNDAIFKYILSEKPEKIVLYTGKNQEVFKKAEQHGYQYTIDNYLENEIFRKNDYITSKLIKKDNSIIEKYLGKNENIFMEALDSGYVITKEKIEANPLFKTSSSMIREAAKKDIECCYLFEGIDAFDFKDIFELTDSKGKKLIPNFETVKKLPYIHKDSEIMKKAIEHDPKNIALYKDEEDKDELALLALSKGYVPQKQDFEENELLCKNDILFQDILKRNNKELLVYYNGDNDEVIKLIFKELLDEKYENIISDEASLSNYLKAWKAFGSKNMHTNLLTFINKDCIEAFQTIDIDYYLVLKYGVNNDKMNELTTIIEQGGIKEYCKFYQLVKDNYIHLDKNAYGVDSFLKIARLYNNYPELAKDMMENKLNDESSSQLISIINKNQFLPDAIKTVKDLEKLSKKQIDKIKHSMNICQKPEEIKELILEYVFDLNYSEFTNILTNYINFDTLDKILAKITKDSNEELYYEAMNLKILLQMLEETVNATDDIGALKELLNTFLESPEEVNKVRSIYYNLKERIRNIYELDAIVTLTDIDKAKELYLRPKKNPDDPDIVELKDQEYVLYAHVVSNPNLEEFVNIRFDGRVTICVSPISNIGKRLFSESGIILGFTKLPRGGFIGSSNKNMSSSDYIKPNDYEPHEDNYYHLEIKDSSSKTINQHPETLLYRDGLIPTCIIIRGENPSQEEIEAKKTFKNLGLDIPFVHTQEIGDIANIQEKTEEVQIIESTKQNNSIFSNEKIDIGTYNPRLEALHEMREKIKSLKKKIDNVKIEKDDVYDLIKLKIGGSHDMYKCHIKGKRGTFYLKPGIRKDGAQIDPYRSEAMKASYLIQKIVNPDNAVFADVVQVRGTKIGLNEDSMITCSIIEEIPSSTSYNGWYNENKSTLSSKEVSSFIQECMADYLLFSYDTKAENFLRDKYGNTYGIDKEQALKYILEPTFAKQDKTTGEYTFDTSFSKHNSQESDFNNCGIIYIVIFDKISQGKIDLNNDNIDAAMKTLERVEAVDDEQYKQIFKGFVDSFIESPAIEDKIMFYTKKGMSERDAKEQVKNDLYDSLLARKYNLRSEFITYFDKILDSYSYSKGVDVSEWKKILNNQGQMK